MDKPEQDAVATERAFDFFYTDARFFESTDRSGMILSWACKGVGFGEITIVDKGGETKIDTETMSRPFVKAAFDHWLGNLVERE